jgi:hypothetical protein
MFQSRNRTSINQSALKTEYEIRHFDIGVHGSAPRRYFRCLELIASVNDALALCDERSDAYRDAYRALPILKRILREFDTHYTLGDMESAEPEHWREVLSRRASFEMSGLGRVTPETQEKLFQCGLSIAPSRDYIREVETQFHEHSGPTIVICIPTLLDQEANREHFLKLMSFDSPKGIVWKNFIRCGERVDNAYNTCVDFCLRQNADFMLTLEDDHEIPPDTFHKLWAVYKDVGPKAVVGAWYRRRFPPHDPCPTVLRDGRAAYLQADGKVHECSLLPQGFTLIPMALFRIAPYPWFVTTATLTQDAFFSQVARNHGYKLYCDTSAQIAHIDRQTGKAV